MKKLLYALLFCFFYSLEGQIITPDPVIDAEGLWGTHYIESFHFTPHGGFAFFNDGSSWIINPDELDRIAAQEAMLRNVPLTIMPEAGTEHYPQRIIIHSADKDDWVDFTAEYLSPPSDQEAPYVCKQVEGPEDYLEICIPLPEHPLYLRLFISPHDLNTSKKWKKGQKVIVGGVWLPEYDLNGPKDYHNSYQYVLFNYDTGDYVFFTPCRWEKIVLRSSEYSQK